MIVDEKYRFTISCFQSPSWDHEKELEEIIKDGSNIYIEFKRDDYSCNNYHINTILIQDQKDSHHFTDLVFREARLYYNSDSYMFPKVLTEMSDRIYVNVSIDEFVDIVKDYIFTLKATDRMNQTLTNISISRKDKELKNDIPDYIDISFRYSYI